MGKEFNVTSFFPYFFLFYLKSDFNYPPPIENPILRFCFFEMEFVNFSKIKS
jgi:hypothetical protein